jgi:hypothetical protein
MNVAASIEPNSFNLPLSSTYLFFILPPSPDKSCHGDADLLTPAHHREAEGRLWRPCPLRKMSDAALGLPILPKKQQKLRPLGLLREHCGPTKPTTKRPHAHSQYYHRKGVAMTASNDLFPFKFIANTQLASLHYWHLLPKMQHQQLHLQSMYVLAARTRTHSKGMGSKQQGMGNLASNE